MRPYNDVRINRRTLLREFNVRIDDIEYTWHRDEDDRIIEVFSGAGWQLQLDNQLPVLLESGCEYHIPAGMWHRLHKGQDNLTILISEGKKGKKGKKSDGFRSVEFGADDNPKTTKMDYLPSDVLRDIAKKRNVDEEVDSLEEKKRKRKRKSRRKKPSSDKEYKKGRSAAQAAALDADVAAVNRARETPGKADDIAAYKKRDERERQQRKAESNIRITSSQLSEIISEAIEEQKLEMMLEKVEELEEKKKRKKRKKSGKSKKGLSKAVKKSLDKKADRRCLTRGSVYAEFRKGLAAYYTSGSRKGMSAHQWAHARVNSANPSKSWAVVKKRKKCPKKKKKK